jgi:putative membrane protein
MRRTTVAAVALTAVTSITLLATAMARRSEAVVPAPASIQALDDPTIVAIFDAANTADIETGELAMQRGQSKEVRDFGAMLAHDHKTVRQQGRDLAKKLGVTPTPPVDDAGAKAHAAAMAKLRAVPATEFDHAFLQHEVAFHKSVIDAVKTTLLPALKNAEVKDLVTKIAPAFQAHMMAAESLDKRLAEAGK